MRISRPSQGVIVLGMHRSGTSAVTSTLAAADWALVGEALPPQPDNPRGYWEPRAVVEIHDDFLRAIGSGWSDPTPLPSEVFLGSEAEAARGRLAEYAEQLVERPRWILKDPRLCRLLPLWRPLLTAAGAEWRYLFVVRYPKSVAASLAARDKLAPPTSMALWLRHYLEAEEATRGEVRRWVSFEDWTAEDPRDLLDALSAWLPKTPAWRLREAHEACLESSLVHHREGNCALPRAVPQEWVSRAWNAMLALSREGREGTELQEIAADLAAADEILLGSYTALTAAVRARWSGSSEEPATAAIARETAEVEILRSALEDSETKRLRLLSEVSAAAAELRQLQVQLNDTIAARDAATAEARAVAVDRDTQEEGRREREAKCRELASQAAVMRQERLVLASELSATEARLEGTLNQLATVTGSRSWRWTAPARRLLGLLSRSD